MGFVVRGIERLSQAGGYVAGAVSVLLTALIAIAVISRRVFNSPLLITEEIAGYMMVAIVFLGLAYTMKMDGHVRADILLSHLPRRAHRALETLATVIALGFAGVLVAGTWRLFSEFYSQGTRSFHYLQTPLWIPGSLLVIGAALLGLQLVARLLKRR
ncbi:MAG: TRAP transporter small permease [candidate division NC10 bacterium]